MFGIESQRDWANVQGSSASLTAPANTNLSRMDAFGLFTGHVGYAFDTTLLYLKGGAAVISDRNDIATNGIVVATAPGDNRWGGTIGVGAEFSFAPNWSAAVEYDHLSIGNYTTTGGVFSTALAAVPTSSRCASTIAGAAPSFRNIGEHRSLLI